MSDDEYHRELAEYEPGDGPSVRHRMRVRVMRVFVVLGLVGLVLPGIIVTIGTQLRTSDAACRYVVAHKAPDSVAAIARFELFGANGPGWYCYAEEFNGAETLVQALGLIPGLRFDPSTGVPA
jgi:hypothetical protein